MCEISKSMKFNSLLFLITKYKFLNNCGWPLQWVATCSGSTGLCVNSKGTNRLQFLIIKYELLNNLFWGWPPAEDEVADVYNVLIVRI